MTPRQLDEWAAYYSVEPWDSESMRHLIARATSFICRSFGAEVEPWHVLGTDEPVKEVSPNQAVNLFRGAG